MKIQTYPNISHFTDLYKLVQDGYIIHRKHATLPLHLYDYTHLCYRKGMWNNTTLQCRGLICNDWGQIVARPFPKFFNVSELREIPDEPFEVYEKIDGSMISVYYYGGEWRCAIRGSFDSEQARIATTVLYDNHRLSSLSPYVTYVCELISPNNRIVVNYGDREELILTGIFHTETGREFGIEMFADVFKIAEKHRINSLDDLLQIQRKNAEGFVIRFHSGLRAKVKHEDYIRLHAIISGMSEYRVWEALSAGLVLEDILEGVPDEMFAWADDVATKLWTQYNIILNAALESYGDIRGATRKDLALQYVQTPYQNVLFAMLDNRNYSKLIWNMIEPKREKENEGNV